MANATPALLPRSSAVERAVTLMIVVLPFLALISAMILWWDRGIGWLEVGLLLGMYVASGLGITVGYHRLFTHRSFKTRTPIRFTLGALGSMAAEGPVLKWVAVHRRHHQMSDRDGDPHSPHAGRPPGWRGVVQGAWHAHMGWIFGGDHPNLAKYVPDLIRDPATQWVSRLFVPWVLLGMLIPALIGGLVLGSWWGVFVGFLWGGLVRLFFVHHITWAINSVCHIWGEQRFESRDESRNNAICGILAFGEGWHNNHHAFPHSARHGLRWWELDTSYLVILLLQRVGLAWDVRLPDRAAIQSKLLRAERPRAA